VREQVDRRARRSVAVRADRDRTAVEVYPALAAYVVECKGDEVPCVRRQRALVRIEDVIDAVRVRHVYEQVARCLCSAECDRMPEVDPEVGSVVPLRDRLLAAEASRIYPCIDTDAGVRARVRADVEARRARRP